MKRRTRYVLVLVLGVVLVNLPLVHSTWTDRRVERSGVDVQASVVRHHAAGGQHLLTFRFPAHIDPKKRAWQADVDATTYAHAIGTGEVGVRVIPDDPSAYRVDGETGNSALVLITLLADAVLLAAAFLLWRYGGRRRPQLRAIAVEDVERSKPGSALDRIEGETFLVRGEVSAIEPGQVVIELGERSVLVYLDGHANPVGYQQSAQVRARLV